MQPNPLKLDESSRFAAQAKDELLREYPELADDEQTLLDTLDGATDLSEVVAVFVASADDDEALSNGAKEASKAALARARRLAERSQKKRQLVARAMERAGVKKVERPEFTVSLKNLPPAVIIDDEGQIAEQFYTVKEVKSLSKTALKQALQSDEIVEGAHLSNGGITAQVRRG